MSAAPDPEITTHDESVLLEVRGVTVRFGGVVANNDVSLACRDQAVTALIGPNGAGKSTLFDVITGVRRPEQGRLFFGGQEITRMRVQDRARLGIVRTFQNLKVVRSMSVLDNVRVGLARRLGYGPLVAMLAVPGVARSDRSMERLVRRALRLVGLEEVADVPAGHLTYGELRRLELARALAQGPRMLLLDEPAAGMDHAETQELSGALRAIRDRWGITVLVVDHDLDLVRRTAEDVFVLDFGIVLAGGRVEDVMRDEAVIAAYLGTNFSAAVR
jgi:branched-chain amino acid transport system ATP-binding protein